MGKALVTEFFRSVFISLAPDMLTVSFACTACFSENFSAGLGVLISGSFEAYIGSFENETARI